MTSQHSRQIISGLLVAFLVALFANIADAEDDIQTLKTAVAEYQSHHRCPPRGEYNILVFAEYCKPFCDRGWTCHGKKDTDPCLRDNTSSECHEFAAGTQQCQGDMNEKNQTINTYNQIVRQCWSQNRENGDNAPPVGPKADPGSMSESQQAQQKADEAREKARETAKKAEDQRAKDQSEKDKLKTQASEIAPSCQQAVANCE